jgi:hypothetical protein
MLKKVFIAASALSLAAGPLMAAELPIRAVSGAAVRSSTNAEVKEYVVPPEAAPADSSLINSATGWVDTLVKNKGTVVYQLAAKSGWSDDQLRAALTQSYSVAQYGVANYLYSPEGVGFLLASNRTFQPYWRGTNLIQGLRAAVINASLDGQLSGAEILYNLPVNFRLNYAALPVCPSPLASGSGEQCTSLLSYIANMAGYVANNQITDRLVLTSEAHVIDPINTTPVPNAKARELCAGINNQITDCPAAPPAQ